MDLTAEVLFSGKNDGDRRALDEALNVNLLRRWSDSISSADRKCSMLNRTRSSKTITFSFYYQ